MKTQSELIDCSLSQGSLWDLVLVIGILTNDMRAKCGYKRAKCVWKLIQFRLKNSRSVGTIVLSGWRSFKTLNCNQVRLDSKKEGSVNNV